MSFRPSNPIEQISTGVTSATSLWLQSDEILSGWAFGKYSKSQQWNPIFAPLQITNSLEGLIAGPLFGARPLRASSLLRQVLRPLLQLRLRLRERRLQEVAVPPELQLRTAGEGRCCDNNVLGSAQGCGAATPGAP